MRRLGRTEARARKRTAAVVHLGPEGLYPEIGCSLFVSHSVCFAAASTEEYASGSGSLSRGFSCRRSLRAVMILVRALCRPKETAAMLRPQMRLGHNAEMVQWE